MVVELRCAGIIEELDDNARNAIHISSELKVVEFFAKMMAAYDKRVGNRSDAKPDDEDRDEARHYVQQMAWPTCVLRELAVRLDN